MSIKNRIVTVRRFLETFDIDISQRKFQLNVSLPRVAIQYKEARSKEGKLLEVGARVWKPKYQEPDKHKAEILKLLSSNEHY